MRKNINIILENILYLLLGRFIAFLFFYTFKAPFAFISSQQVVNTLVYYVALLFLHWWIGIRIGRECKASLASIIVLILLPYFAISALLAAVWKIHVLEYFLAAILLSGITFISANLSSKQV